MDDRIERVCRAITPPHRASARLSQVRQLTLARPAGSLGVLDETVHRIAAIRGAVPSGVPPVMISVLAGDHGVAERGTSAFRAGLTAPVLELILAGQAPVNLLADRVPARVCAADVGLRTPVGDDRFRVGAGTADICDADAMPLAGARAAMEAGVSYTEEHLGDAELVAVGEIGVGNTTATSVLAARMLGLDPADVVGRGSGVDDATLLRKRDLVAMALARNAVAADDPVELLAAFGGYEIAANVGVILAAASARRVVLLDGFITGVAALLAARLCPAVTGYLVAGHQSAEPGHGAVLDALGLRPLLTLDMRLGMASGAALALGLLTSALAVATGTPPARAVGLAGAGTA